MRWKKRFTGRRGLTRRRPMRRGRRGSRMVARKSIPQPRPGKVGFRR